MCGVQEVISISESTLLIFDLETTGVDVSEDRIVQIGAVYWRDGKRVGPRRSMLVNPGMPIPEEASQIHGISDAMVADAPAFDKVGAKFVEHLMGSENGGAMPIVCGYNALRFDVPLLNAELTRHGAEYQVNLETVLDPFIFVSWGLRGAAKLNLGTTSSRYGFDLKDAHSAAADAEATGHVVSGLIAEDLMPDDVDEALDAQRHMLPKIIEEWSRFMYYLYSDRETGELVIGFGKHRGTMLNAVDPDYLRFCLSKFDEIPDDVLVAFKERIGD